MWFQNTGPKLSLGLQLMSTQTDSELCKQRSKNTLITICEIVISLWAISKLQKWYLPLTLNSIRSMHIGIAFCFSNTLKLVPHLSNLTLAIPDTWSPFIPVLSKVGSCSHSASEVVLLPLQVTLYITCPGDFRHTTCKTLQLFVQFLKMYSSLVRAGPHLSTKSHPYYLDSTPIAE